VEIEDCESWLNNSRDNDNNALYARQNKGTISIAVGNPAENTIQQINLYKTSYLCIIVVNLEDNLQDISLEAIEKDKDEWEVIE